MDLDAVKTSYARWAPVYDKTFGALTNVGRRHVVQHINGIGGDVLEVGVGTGLSLPYYHGDVRVTGIDYSEEMLAKAKKRRRRQNLDKVVSLQQMDARALEFPDDHFDFIAAMHMLSVVPDPERVMAEMARVCKPGGRILIANHFHHQRGPFSVIGKVSAPMANFIGWHSDFKIERVLGEDGLTVVEKMPLPPIGLMTFLMMEKDLAA